MDRQIVYPGQIPLDTDLLSTNKNTMIAVAKLAAAVLGTAAIVNGLSCVPTAPASLNVTVNPGEIYSLANMDATGYGSLPSDTTHQILKQGILLDAVTLACPAPGTVGQSINYLIQATYADVDNNPVVLPYFNASNPSQAFSGPSNSGSSQNTVRSGACTVTVKAGAAATTGTQTTPAADAGFTGLWVVTVANGQLTITSGNIVQLAGSPIIAETLTQKISQATGDVRYVIGAPFALTSIISPTQITTNQNDYAPTGLSTASTLRLSSNARVNVTGISGGAAGRILIVHNVGTFPIVFTYQDTNSLVANRLAFHTTLGGGQSMEIQYDVTSSVWRAKSVPEPIGTIKDFGMATLAGGYLAIDQNVSRTTYAALFNEVGTTWGAGDGSTTFGLFIGAGRSRIAAGTGTVTETITSQTAAGNAVPVGANSAKWITGMPVTVSGASGFTGLTNGSWFIVRASSSSVQFATSLTNAQNGTVATITGTGSAVITGALTARTLGELGGEETHAMSITELLSHGHNSSNWTGSNLTAGGGSAPGTTPTNTGTSNTGGNAAMNNMQPFAAVNVGIRYC